MIDDDAPVPLPGEPFLPVKIERTGPFSWWIGNLYGCTYLALSEEHAIRRYRRERDRARRREQRSRTLTGDELAP